MAILKIARMGHPVLKRRADDVQDPTGPEIANLIKDMEDTLADVGGVGLAAPQVHVPLRVVIFHVPKARLEMEDAPAHSSSLSARAGLRVRAGQSARTATAGRLATTSSPCASSRCS